MKPKKQPGRVNERRFNTLNRLKNQLESGVKHNNGITQPLTKIDVERINKEILILEVKIVNPKVARTSNSKKYRGVRRRLSI